MIQIFVKYVKDKMVTLCYSLEVNIHIISHTFISMPLGSTEEYFNLMYLLRFNQRLRFNRKNIKIEYFGMSVLCFI